MVFWSAHQVLAESSEENVDPPDFIESYLSCECAGRRWQGYCRWSIKSDVGNEMVSLGLLVLSILAVGIHEHITLG